MALNDDCKYVLSWLIPCLVFTVLVFALGIVSYYLPTAKFVDAGYHQEQMVGSYGIIWKK